MLNAVLYMFMNASIIKRWHCLDKAILICLWNFYWMTNSDINYAFSTHGLSFHYPEDKTK